LAQCARAIRKPDAHEKPVHPLTVLRQPSSEVTRM
jgi:hypothetical protein